MRDLKKERKSMNERRRTVTIPEAAAALGVAPKTLYRAVGRGEVPAIRVGRRLLISREILDTLIRSARYPGSDSTEA